MAPEQQSTEDLEGEQGIDESGKLQKRQVTDPTAPDEGDEGDDDKDGGGLTEEARETLSKEQNQRSGFGCAYVFFAGLLILGALIVAHLALPTIPNSFEEVARILAEHPEQAYVLLYALAVTAGTHAVITISAVYIGYQLLQSAERFFVPLKLVDDAKDLLGLESPHDGIARELWRRLRGEEDELKELKSMIETSGLLDTDDSD